MKGFFSSKIKILLFEGGRFAAAALLATAVLFLGSFPVLAQKINNEEWGQIQKILGIDNNSIFSKYAEAQIKKVLNQIIKPEESPDLTYGILVLGALDEMEFMDMILSQKYKDQEREYFNSLLDKKLNLVSRWKNVGESMISLIKKGESASPMSSLTLESVSITNKTIEIFSAFNVLRENKKYDGLWQYFDSRRNGESHEIAWGDAKIVMGFVAKPVFNVTPIAINKEKQSQLEPQFAALYDKWGPYADAGGIKQQAKEKIKSELRNTLAIALESQNFAEKKPQSSLVSRAKSFLEDMGQSLARLKILADALKNTIQAAGELGGRALASIQSVVSRINPLKAGLVFTLKDGLEENAEVLGVQEDSAPNSQIQPTVDPAKNLVQIQDEIDDITEQIDILSQKSFENESANTGKAEKMVQKDEQLTQKPEEILEPKFEPDAIIEAAPKEDSEKPAPVRICEKKPEDSPAQNRVIFNEIAWMGSQDSANDEWMELKNLMDSALDLSGWQILDAEQQIKIIFTDKNIITANSFFLLERTDDNSVPRISADLIYTGALNNTNESLYLFDKNCQLQDEIIASPKWPAGDDYQKQTMQRDADLTWYAYNGIFNNGIGGTPRAANSPKPIPANMSGGGGALALVAAAENLPTPKILITEVQIKDATSSDHDFIEIYNPDTAAFDISGFQLKKKSSSGAEYSIRLFPQGSSIPAQGYFLWANSNYASSGSISADVTSGDTLADNNSVALLDLDKNIIDAVAWGTSSNPFAESSPFSQNPAAGKTLGRKWSTTTQNYIDTDNNSIDFETQNPTPKAANSSSTDDSGGGGSGENPTLSVIFNEIAWMGTQASAQDEWIELYNNTTNTIDIAGWNLKSLDNSPSIVFSTSSAVTIPAHSYFLLERTNDSTVSDILADWFGSFGTGLSNDGEELELRDNTGKLIDKAGCQKNEAGSCVSWFSGNNTTKQTMERINSSASGTEAVNWANNNRVHTQPIQGFDANNSKIQGTPKAQNSVSKTSTYLPTGLIINDKFTLAYLGSPYLIEGSINVLTGADLTIEPGVIIKFKHHSSLYSEFKVEGTLTAIGVENKKIVFTSFKDDEYGGDTNGDGAASQPAAGDWEWFYLLNSSSTIKNMVLRYAGKLEGGFPNPLFTRGALRVSGGQAIIEKSRVEKSQTVGVWLTDSLNSSFNEVEFLDLAPAGQWEKPAAFYISGAGAAATVKNSTFKNNKVGILIESGGSSVIQNNIFQDNETSVKTNTLADFSGNTAQNNNINGILLTGIVFPAGVDSAEWKGTDLPHVVENLIQIPAGKTLNIKPGVVVKLKNGGKIYIDGTLTGEGSAAQKIIFTSFYDDDVLALGDTNNDSGAAAPAAGDWRSVYFSVSSQNSILNNVIVRYGGYYNSGWGGGEGAVSAQATFLNISNSIIENNLFAGVELNNATATIQNMTFQNHTAQYNYNLGNSSGLYLRNSNPAISASQFQNNYYGIYREGTSNPLIGDGVSFSGNNVDIFPALP